MGFCEIGNDDWAKTKIEKIIELLFEECMGAGGDGDAFWYSKFYNVKDILPFVEKYNLEKQDSFFTIEFGDDRIICHNNQECVIITNNKEEYENLPSWAQMVLVN